MKMKEILTLSLFFIPLAGFAISCPDPSVFQKANLVKSDKYNDMNRYQSKPQAADGWTIVLMTTEENYATLDKENEILKAAKNFPFTRTLIGFPFYDKDLYCEYVVASPDALAPYDKTAFMATQGNGPIA